MIAGRPETPANSLRVLAGGSRRVALRLVGVESELGTSRLRASDVVNVDLRHTGTGVTPSPARVHFGSPATMTEVITLSAAGDAVPGNLRAEAGARQLPPDALLVPSPYPIEIVERILRPEFLAETQTLEYRRFPNISVSPPPAGARETRAEDTIQVPVVGSIESVSLSIVIEFTSQRAVVVELFSPMAMGEFGEVLDDLSERSPDGVRTVRKTYDVTGMAGDSIPAENGRALVGTNPQGAWRLVMTNQFPRSLSTATLTEWSLRMVVRVSSNSSPLLVHLDGSTRVPLGLFGVQVPGLGTSQLLSGESLEFDLAYAGEGGVMLSEPRLTLSGQATPPEVTLTAQESARPGHLVAVPRGVLPTTRLVPELAKREVRITPRRFTLTFTPEVIGIVPGSTRSVTLSLRKPELLEAGEQVPVILTVPEGTSLRLSRTEFTLDGDTTTGTLDLGVPVGVSTHRDILRARVPASHGLPNADFVFAELPVNVIDRRDFSWAFRSAETGEVLEAATAVRGGSREDTLLSLEGDLGALLGGDETVEASVSFTGGTGITVQPLELTFTPGMQTLPLTLAADVNATIEAIEGVGVGRLEVEFTGTTGGPNDNPLDPLMVENIEEEASLPVVLAREFTLAFTTLDGDPLDTLPLLSTGTTRVSLTLSGAAPLEATEMVRVSFDYTKQYGIPSTDVTVVQKTVVFSTASGTAVDLTLRATLGAQSGTLMARVHDAADVPADVLPIAPASLPV